MNTKIVELEEKLRLAMCSSDVAALESLLAEKLIFTNHLGKIISKAEDIASHREKVFVINYIILSNQKVIDLGNSAVVTTQADISGHYNGQLTAGNFRFTRVWTNGENGWQVIAGHSCIIA